jgi:hypothetical protein
VKVDRLRAGHLTRIEGCEGDRSLFAGFQRVCQKDAPGDLGGRPDLDPHVFDRAPETQLNGLRELAAPPVARSYQDV